MACSSRFLRLSGAMPRLFFHGEGPTRINDGALYLCAITVLSVTMVINGNKTVIVEVCKALKKSPCSVLRECVSSCTRCSADYDLEQQPEEKTG